jgi:hypothetical protein
MACQAQAASLNAQLNLIQLQLILLGFISNFRDRTFTSSLHIKREKYYKSETSSIVTMSGLDPVPSSLGAWI